jgi:DUF4097 and DUF4098 domain-containing protein YvlB
MNRTRALLALTAIALATAPVLPAQSGTERNLDRLADRISREVERSVEQAMRSVALALGDLRYRVGDHDLPYRLHDPDLQDGGQRIDTTFAFSRTGLIDLTSVSGDIVVTGWNRDQVRVTARTERGRLRWRLTSSRVTIETESVRGRTGDTRYELSVPQGVRVVLRSTSGDLTANDIHGPVDANTINGEVEVTDAIDRVGLRSLSGDIHASRLTGDIEGGSVNGTIRIDDADARSIQLGSTSGDLVFRNVRTRSASASTVSGDVEYHGTIESGGQYDFHSHSGDISLYVPANVNAQFSVATFNGDLDSGGFPITLQPSRNRQRGQRLEFTLGSGGDARVVAETFSGNIVLHRDGRR